ncbi:hypothetical protein Bca101_026534 [Brassica carinata]
MVEFKGGFLGANFIHVMNLSFKTLMRSYLSYKRFCGGEAGSSSTTSKYGGVKELKSVTLQELNSYVLNSTPHVRQLNKDVEFICKPEVADIDPTN